MCVRAMEGENQRFGVSCCVCVLVSCSQCDGKATILWKQSGDCFVCSLSFVCAQVWPKILSYIMVCVSRSVLMPSGFHLGGVLVVLVPAESKDLCITVHAFSSGRRFCLA